MLSTLIDVLICTGSCAVGTKALGTPALDEAELRILRFREVAKEVSRKTFYLCSEEFDGFDFSARLYKVICILVEAWFRGQPPFTLPSSRIPPSFATSL